MQIQGTDQISVALPGIKNVDQAVRTVGQTAQLQFFNDAKQRVSGPADSLAAAVKTAKTSPLVAADRPADRPSSPSWPRVETSTEAT